LLAELGDCERKELMTTKRVWRGKKQEMFVEAVTVSVEAQVGSFTGGCECE
jgi:hypothetical protein